MDRDAHWDVELPDLQDIDLDDGDGDDGDQDPPVPPGGGGGPGGPFVPPAEPFLQSRWGAWVAAGLILLFGLQTVAVMWVSRSGIGTEAVAWLLSMTFVVSFTVVFIAGARFIARHRY